MFAEKLRDMAGTGGSGPEIRAGTDAHTRISTTMNIYAQAVPAAQRLAIEKLSAFAKPSPSRFVTLLSQ
jgi:hypothetical protein